MKTSVHEIRNRLLVLLARAFVIALILSLVFIIGVISYVILSPSMKPKESPSALLIGYYLGHGSWDGVETIIALDNDLKSTIFLLLDENNRVVLDRRPDSTTRPGSIYEPGSDEVPLELTLNGKKMGVLVASSKNLFGDLIGISGILFPVILVSTILAMFMVVAAVLLMRRFVDPLADVIFAAQEMAQGRLNTRIATDKGPQDLRSLSESFNEMATSLERNDRERREMLADVAHELRTPLSVIRGRLEGIVDGIYPDNGSEVSMALEQTYVLQRLVDDLRLLTLAETRQLVFDKRDIQVADVINRVLELFSAEAQEKNISLSFREESGNTSAMLDPQRLEQIISNLVGNAIRYVPEGGKVWVTASEVHGSVKIIVNDNGTGIPAEDLPFIFDRFWRKEKSRARSTGGTGLGLAIAKQLVEAQGGMIEAQNLPEGGLQIAMELRKN